MSDGVEGRKKAEEALFKFSKAITASLPTAQQAMERLSIAFKNINKATSHFVQKLDFEWQPQDGNECYVCSGKVVLGWNSKDLYALKCIDCSDCQTAFYNTPLEAIDAYQNKVLF